MGGLGAAAYYGDSTKVLRDISHLGAELDRRWGALTLNGICKKGEWCATLQNKHIEGRRAEMGHNVVVEGFTQHGTISILDPWQGTRYEMTRENFLLHWNGYAAIRE